MKLVQDNKIALFGRSGSGKGLVSRILVNNHGFVRVSSGELCRQTSLLLFGNQDRHNLNRVSEALRSISQDILIKAALRSANSAPKIVFDSMRYESDYHWFKAKGFSQWRVRCPRDLCIQRLRQRGQVFDISDLDHASEDALEANEFDFEIENSGADDAEIEMQIKQRLVGRQ